MFSQADFARSGGCGDVLVFATSADDTLGFTVQWDTAASTAWAQSGYQDSVTLPDEAAQVFLVHGSMLSQSYCTDILVNGQGPDAHVPATAGTIEIVVTPDADGFQPSSHANVTLRDVTFEIAQGGATEVWRIELVELQNLSVGWLAG